MFTFTKRAAASFIATAATGAIVLSGAAASAAASLASRASPAVFMPGLWDIAHPGPSGKEKCHGHRTAGHAGLPRRLDQAR